MNATKSFFLASAISVLGIVLPAQSASAQPSQGDPVARLTATEDDKATDFFGAVGASLRLLMIEHGTRIAFQEKTRRELGGPFWADYKRSVRWPGQWDDTDAWWVNYIGHPIHGAAAGQIWLDHGKAGETGLSFSRRYWSSRGRAVGYSAAYSLQFEIGPLSEASIGNVGMKPETTGWVDHVVTPTGALVVLVAEDALDRYFVERLERRTGNRVARATLRMLFNPSRTLANLAQNRAPWNRSNRPIGWVPN